jgi:uncharacterized RDD family membrane protein YckC
VDHVTAVTELDRSARQEEPPELLFDLPGHAERALAFGIDVVLVWVQMMILALAVGAFRLDTDPTIDRLWPIVAWAIGLGYFVYFWVRNGQTPGMMPFGQRVVRADDLGSIGLGTALLRLAGLLLAIATIVGVLWILVDPRRRGLHDRLAGTQVIAG